MAARRVVVIRDFDMLHKEVQKKAAAVIADTPDTTLVVVEGEKAAIAPKPKTGFVRESFKPVYENKLPGWIRERFRKRGKTVEEPAVALLINNVGTQLGDLDGEIGKAIIIAGERNRVTEEDVGIVVGAFRRETVWGLSNAVGLGDFREAARILDNLMVSEKNRETYYLAALFSHILKIAAYNGQVKAGIPQKEAMKTVASNKFFWDRNEMAQQTKNLTPRRVRRMLNAIGRTESLLKKSSVDKRLLVELMLPFVVPPRRGSRTS
jgi:DNA polymerase-3 subunit delta